MTKNSARTNPRIMWRCQARKEVSKLGFEVKILKTCYKWPETNILPQSWLKKHNYKDYPTSRPGIWEKYSPERAKQK